MIVTNNNEYSLIVYANKLPQRYIIEQVQYFPNIKRVIYFWIITAHELFKHIIVYNELPINGMPPVQLSSFIEPQEEEIL